MAKHENGKKAQRPPGAKMAPAILNATAKPVPTTGWTAYARSNPYFPGFVLLLLAIIVALCTYKDYGMAWDEPLQRGPGLLNFNYMFHGDTQFLQRGTDNHGAGYEVLLIILEKILGLTDSRDIFQMRHLATHFLFLCGAFSLYVLAYRLYGNKWVACLAFLSLVLMPRLYAHSFFNSKDLPFLSLVAVIFCLSQSAFSKSKPYLFLILGLVTGYATSIRIMGVLFATVVVVFLFIDLVTSWRDSARRRTILLSSGLFVSGFCVLLYAAWPYLWRSPVHHFIESFTKLSHFELWNGSILVAGQYMQSEHLPWTYIPAWFLATNPELWLVAGFAGIGTVLVAVVRHPALFLRNNTERNLLFYLIAFVIPIAAVIMLHSVVYDDWRHLYFVYPPFILLALYVLNKLFMTRYSRVVMGLCGAQLLLLAGFMVLNHPFSQVYFNNFIPHSPGYIQKNYEMDYWGCSFRQGLDYLLETDKTDKIKVNCDYNALLDNNVMMLAPDDRPRFQYADLANCDYYITNFRGHYVKFPPGSALFSIKVLGSDILSVYRNDKSPAVQDALRQANITALRDFLATAPDDQDAMARIAGAFEIGGQYDSSEAYYKRALIGSPRAANLLTGLAGTYFKQKRYAEAISVFRQQIALDPDNAETYSNIAVCFFYAGQPDSAVTSLKCAIAMKPENPSYDINLANIYTNMKVNDSANKYKQLYFTNGGK